MKEEDFEILVNSIRAIPGSGSALTALLKEQHVAYEDKSAAAVNRMRGYVYYSFSINGTPDKAIKYLLEEMESGDNAYTIAAAALAIRHSGARSEKVAGILMKGLNRAIQKNGYLSFDTYRQNWPLSNQTSAVEEVLKTISWMGSYAFAFMEQLELLLENGYVSLSDSNVDRVKETILEIRKSGELKTDCCTSFVNHNDDKNTARPGWYKRRSIRKSVQLQAQDGNTISMDHLLKDRYSLIAFFYTRCENPAKCSLTISNLAAIQKKLIALGHAENINITAISYDSYNDSPTLLQAYGAARGLKWNEHTRMLRVTSDFNRIRDYFDLGVNFNGPVINRHSIELYMVDTNGDIVERFQRSQMDNDHITSQIVERLDLYNKQRGRFKYKLKRMVNNSTTVLVPVLFALLPKCPFCLAAYLSAFGLTGIQLAPYFPYLLPVIAVMMLINLYALYKMGVQRGSFVPFLLCLAGSLMVVTFRFIIPSQPGSIVGCSLLFSGVILNGLPKQFRVWQTGRFRTTEAAIK